MAANSPRNSMVLAVLAASLLTNVEVHANKDGKPQFKDGKDGEREPVMRRVRVEEVLSHRIDLTPLPENPAVITVVTTGGKKVSGPLPKTWKPPEEDEGAGDQGGGKE